MQVVIIPTHVVRAGQIKARPIVCNKHAVLFQGTENDLIRRRKAAEIEIGLEPKAQTHGRVIGIGAGVGQMTRGPDIIFVPLGHRKPKGMVNDTIAVQGGLHFVIVYEPGQNGQTGGIRTGPTRGAQRVAL